MKKIMIVFASAALAGCAAEDGVLKTLTGDEVPHQFLQDIHNN